MNMCKIVQALATVKIVPVSGHNLSQFSPWSWSSLVSLVIWFLVPGAFFVYAEVRLTAEVSPFPSLARDSYASLAYFLTSANMLMMLLTGSQLLGLLMRRDDTLIDLEQLPMSSRQWMIWLAVPLVTLGNIPGGIYYSSEVQQNPSISWDVATVLCIVPYELLSFVYI